MTQWLRIAIVVAAGIAVLSSRVLMFPTNALLFLVLVALLWPVNVQDSVADPRGPGPLADPPHDPWRA